MTDLDGNPFPNPYMARLARHEIDRVAAALGPRYDTDLKSHSAGQLAEMAAAELAAFTTEWGLRKHGQDKPRHCTEHAAWLAAPDETPVSRVVGPWQDTTPNPPAGDQS